MSEKSKTPKKWTWSEEDCPWAGIGGARVTMDEPDQTFDCSLEHARLIVASHNACLGIPVEALEAGALGMALRALQGILGMHAWRDLDDPEFATQQERLFQQAAKALAALGKLS